MNRGIAYAALAFLIWGLFPLYFKALHEVPPVQILAHRMVWSLAVVVAMLGYGALISATSGHELSGPGIDGGSHPTGG